MEQYYFLQKNGNSQGPYRLVDLKKLAIQADDLVWRNNTNEWVKASDLEELSDIIIAKAPPVDESSLNIAGLYYFIQQKGIKKGPFKLQELKQLTIYFDELVWRSDSDQWKKSSDFEEFRDSFVIKPPPTPTEQNITEVNKKFVSKIFGRLVYLYITISVLIGIISYTIAQTSWENYIKETEGKYLGNTRSSNAPGYVTDYELMMNKRYPYYRPNSNNESAYGYGQGFWFRSFIAFGGTVYLTEEEQRNSNALLGNLMLSSFASLSFIFVAIGLIYYTIQRVSTEVEIETSILPK